MYMKCINFTILSILKLQDSTWGSNSGMTERMPPTCTADWPDFRTDLELPRIIAKEWNTPCDEVTTDVSSPLRTSLKSNKHFAKALERKKVSRM